MAPGMLSSLCDMLKPPEEDSDSDEDKVCLCIILQDTCNIVYFTSTC